MLKNNKVDTFYKYETFNIKILLLQQTIKLHFNISSVLAALSSNVYLREITPFLQRVRILAMHTAVIVRGILSVRPSVRHIPVFCPKE